MSRQTPDTELIRRIAFSHVKGLNVTVADELLRRIGGVDAFFDSPTRVLWEKIGSQKSFCTDTSRQALLEAARREYDFISKNSSVGALFFEDSQYPSRLRECVDAPAMLYRLGDCDLNSPRIISVVGTRRATAYGLRYTSDLIAALAERIDNLVVVSGLAYGIDVAAHKAALNAGVPTVAVVAHGLNTIYPAEHRDIAARIVRSGGAILTEYTSEAAIHRGNFLARNRIVAGVADITIIVESEEKGGAMVTASIAASYDRAVGAAPGRASDRYSAGPLKLILNNTAALIRNADDVVELMNWPTKKASNPAPELNFADRTDRLGPEQKKIVEYLRRVDRSTVNEMVEALQMPYALLSARLMELEMDDIVNALPGSAFTLNV